METEDSKNFMVLNSLNDGDTLGLKSGEFDISETNNKLSVKKRNREKNEPASMDNLKEMNISNKSIPNDNLNIVIEPQKDYINNMEYPQNSYGSDIIFTHKKSKNIQNKRILELHYNLLFALANHAKKLMKEGYNSLQEEILTNYTKKTFENLIYFIESKIDFKKIVNLICLINFTNHGFYKDEYDEIILKIIQNFHINCVYVLLKMDSFGFFTIKNDIFGVSDVKFKNKKKHLFGGKGTILDRVPLSGQSHGIQFGKLAGNAEIDNKKVMNFNQHHHKKSVSRDDYLY
jgi:hypothetical protein